MEGVVTIAAVAEKNLLAPLSNHTKRWLKHPMNLLERCREAAQMNSLDRLDVAICVGSPCDPIHQFLAVDPHLLGLTFGLLMIDHIHWTLLMYFSSAVLKFCRIVQFLSRI